MKTSHIVIGAAVVGGFLWYQDQQKQQQIIAQQTAYQASAPQSSWASLVSGLISGVTQFIAAPKKGAIVSSTGTQAVPGSAYASSSYSSGTPTPFTPSTGIPAPTLGSLGSYGGKGSLGGCRGNLGCGRYGSLG